MLADAHNAQYRSNGYINFIHPHIRIPFVTVTCSPRHTLNPLSPSSGGRSINFLVFWKGEVLLQPIVWSSCCYNELLSPAGGRCDNGSSKPQATTVGQRPLTPIMLQ